MDVEAGISIIMNDWIRVCRDELVHFITDERHLAEAEAMIRWAHSHNVVLKTTVIPSHLVQNGELVEQMAGVLSYTNVIIGATDYSFITTDAVRQATRQGARFLSLPLSCADGSSLLEQEFVTMDTRWAARAARKLLKYINAADTIRITTQAGTDLLFSKKGRTGKFFNGVAAKKGAIASASFETYIPIVETVTEGELWLDASMGYLGKITEPFAVSFRGGKIICENQKSPDAKRLCRYLEDFHDPHMYFGGELGIGLNRISKCRGVSYIEDESAYGTFHIGMGRNLALGGQQQAAGHFDIITYRPDIYADNVLIMKNGEIAV
jgi:leucyl aminopeptidase (aminopeptidase T)